MNETRSLARTPEIVAAIAFAWLAFLVLYAAGRPLGTDDLWWHLKLGESWVHEGTSLEHDPLLHTAENPPDPASWLFDVTLYGLDRGLGLQALRAFHAGLVALIVWQVYGLFRRASGSRVFALAAGSVWLALSWYRLFQLRPHLSSILATLLLVRLLFEPGGAPSWRRIALAMGVLLLWANSHALYLLGALLCGGAFVGVLLRALLARLATAGAGAAAAPEGWVPARPALVRFGAATGLSLLVTMLNPRGASRHLTFFRSSSEQAIWRISDEWTPFHPFHWSDANPALSLVSTTLVDGLFLTVAVVAVVSLVRAVRAPSSQALGAIDPVDLGFAAAAFVAIAAAVRFEWLAVFPLLFLARHVRGLHRQRPGATRATAFVAALVCASLAVAVPTASGYAQRTKRVPRTLGRYVGKPIDGFKYHTQGVLFLRDAGLEGNLFNSYFMGGYLGYWLAPRLKTFVGGTLNYPPRVAAAHRAIATFDGAEVGEAPLSLLDRNAVDVFFGIGLPIGGSAQRNVLYTAANLAGAPGWMLVFRSLRTAIYLRTNERNERNLSRVVDFYRREQVPFDPAQGFDVDRVIRERARWAERRGLVPPGHARLVADSERAETRDTALDRLADAHAAAGAWRLQAANDRELLSIEPGHRRALQRLIHAELRADRRDRAGEYVRRLMEVAGDDPRSRAFAIGFERYVEAREQSEGLRPTEGGPSPASAILNRLPLFTEQEAKRAIGG